VGGTANPWYMKYDDVLSDTDINYAYTYRVRAYNHIAGQAEPPKHNDRYSAYSNEASAKGYSFSQLLTESGGTGCFIATAAFGTPLAEEVIVLKKFRDNVLLKTVSGKEFVRFYYAFSPPIADFIRNKSLLKTIVREYLEPLIWFSKQITK